jgi:hypothetical protein
MGRFKPQNVPFPAVGDLLGMVTDLVTPFFGKYEVLLCSKRFSGGWCCLEGCRFAGHRREPGEGGGLPWFTYVYLLNPIKD